MSGWREQEGVLSSPLLEGIGGLAHGFTTRSRGSMAGTIYPREEQQANRRALAGALGMTLVRVKQVAGDDVVLVADGTAQRLRDGRAVAAADPSEIDADAIATLDRGTVLAVAVADCAPVLVATSERWVGIAHAGWAGTARGVVSTLCRELALRGADLREARAVIGPAIGPCCYVIGAERAQEIRARVGTAHLVDRGAGTFTFDLWGANAAQLAAAGITEIDQAGVCTGHEVARFFSHRAEAGAAGRSLAFIGWRS